MFDRTTGRVTLESLTPEGQVLPGDSAVEDINLLSDVFLLDRVTGLMSRISAGPGGWAEESAAPQVDAAGDVIAFTSRHPIDERDIHNDFDLFIRVR